MNPQNNEPIFKTGTNLYMNIKTPETVFVTGRGMKDTGLLICGVILLLTLVCFPIGIVKIINYFRCRNMTIAVSNLRITGRSYTQNCENIPLGQVNAVRIQGNGVLCITYTNDFGQRRNARFPKMENAEQIYNTIYSLVFPPSVTPQM